MSQGWASSRGVDEPASHRGTTAGDYVFGRAMRRVAKRTLDEAPEAPAWAHRSNLSEGTVVVTVKDARRRERIRTFLETAGPDLDRAFAVEGALWIASGEEPGLRTIPAAETPKEARTLRAALARQMDNCRVGREPNEEELAMVRDNPEDWPDGLTRREPDAVIVEWMAALKESGKERERT